MSTDSNTSQILPDVSNTEICSLVSAFAFKFSQKDSGIGINSMKDWD